MKRQMIMLRNLNCPNCAVKLEKAAKQLPGMKSAAVSFGTGALNVEFDETQLRQERLMEVIRQLGIDVASVMDRS